MNYSLNYYRQSILFLFFSQAQTHPKIPSALLLDLKKINVHILLKSFNSACSVCFYIGDSRPISYMKFTFILSLISYTGVYIVVTMDAVEHFFEFLILILVLLFYLFLSDNLGDDVDYLPFNILNVSEPVSSIIVFNRFEIFSYAAYYFTL